MKDRNKEVRIEVVGRRRRRRKQLLDYLKKTRDYCKLKEEALDRDLWRIRFGRGNGRLSEGRLHETNERVYYHRLHLCILTTCISPGFISATPHTLLTECPWSLLCSGEPTAKPTLDTRLVSGTACLMT